MVKCNFCEREFENPLQMGGHTIWCKNNPNSEKIKQKISQNQRGPNNASRNPEVQKKLSNTIKEKIINNSWHLSFSHSRIHEYKGEKFHGKWELEYAKWLDKNNILWRRPKEKFPYFLDGIKGFYTPDFYLEDEKLYIEIKGYPTKKDFSKWDSFPLNLKILTGRDLKNLGLITSYKSRNVQYKNYSWK